MGIGVPLLTVRGIHRFLQVVWGFEEKWGGGAMGVRVGAWVWGAGGEEWWEVVGNSCSMGGGRRGVLVGSRKGGGRGGAGSSRW